MRIDKLAPQGQDLPITWPNGEETGITFKVISADSKNFYSVVTKQAQAALGREKEPTIEERQQQTAEQVASCIIGWSNLEDEQGAPLPYSHEKATELMANPEYAFIREQVEAYVVKRSNFFRAGEGNTGRNNQQPGKTQHTK